MAFLHRHRLEDSKQEEMSLTYVPYWIVSVSARTSITVANQNRKNCPDSYRCRVDGSNTRRNGRRCGRRRKARRRQRRQTRFLQGLMKTEKPVCWNSRFEANTNHGLFGMGMETWWRKQESRANGCELQLPCNRAKKLSQIISLATTNLISKAGNYLTSPNYPKKSRYSTATSARKAPKLKLKH